MSSNKQESLDSSYKNSKPDFSPHIFFSRLHLFPTGDAPCLPRFSISSPTAGAASLPVPPSHGLPALSLLASPRGAGAPSRMAHVGLCAGTAVRGAGYVVCGKLGAGWRRAPRVEVESWVPRSGVKSDGAALFQGRRAALAPRRRVHAETLWRSTARGHGDRPARARRAIVPFSMAQHG